MISCILGSKNRVSKIKACLESVYKNYESINVEPDIIVIDGGSSEDLLSYLRSCKGVSLIQENGLHGVTRAYNKGFRLAKYEFVTWLSDDLILSNDMFKNFSKHSNIGPNDIVAISMDNGSGYQLYDRATPVGFCRKQLMKNVDFWSEDYITYYSDIDFCFKAKSVRGKIITDPSIKMRHNVDFNDELHRENSAENSSTNRGVKVWNVTNNLCKTSERIYPNIFITASSLQELLNKVQKVWLEYSWCNIYTSNTFGSNLEHMNVFISEDNKVWHLKF
jgi:GT2 family glycosyltransferase